MTLDAVSDGGVGPADLLREDTCHDSRRYL